MELNSNSIIGVVGAGAMGSGIAQVAATAGHKVVLFDRFENTLNSAKTKINKILDRLNEKGRLSEEEVFLIKERILYVDELIEIGQCDLIVEAIVEDLTIKKQMFSEMEGIVKMEAVLASNTSSLSIASIAGELTNGERVIGVHFFNPAPLMPLVEVVPSLITSSHITTQVFDLVKSWGKKVVLAKDTPGFIVNRVARPFYSEAIKMYEEGFADFVTIDWAMREIGGFRMGPFQLTDLIGHDVNFVVTETVWKEMFYDPRYKPSITQKRLKEANRFGRKSGQGFYSYREDVEQPSPDTDLEKGKQILNRILFMLINEAVDAKFLNIASVEDIETAMTKGVNYPKGLIQWGKEIGFDRVLKGLEELHERYGDDRYRPSVLLKDLVSGTVTI